jgi:hypothetical protein
MKNIVIVDIDTDREHKVLLGKPEDITQPSTPEEASKMVLDDMTSLCDGLVTLIHAAHDSGFVKDHVALDACIKRIQEGFVDTGYVDATKMNLENLPEDKKED